MTATVVPAATLLRQLPGRVLVLGRSDVAHVHATVARARCGWRLPDDADLVDDVDAAPPFRVCGRCLGSLPPSQVASLRPGTGELGRLHARQARLSAQRCIDELEEIRRRMRLDGSGSMLCELVRAAPAPRPPVGRYEIRTRAQRMALPSGHVAVAETLPLAKLLNALTPGGYGPDHQLYLIDPPAAGSRVDPQARR